MRNMPEKRGLVSIADLDRQAMEQMFVTAREFREKLQRNERLSALAGFVVATVFLQPSTRTRLSFEAAVLRLGGEVLSMSDPSTSRSGPGWRESLDDTARVLDSYTDAVVLRHSEAGAACRYAEISSVPVINGGDGVGSGSEHPTQGLLDLFTIDDLRGSVDGLTICILGDFRQRCVHSLLLGLAEFSNVTVLGVTEEATRLPESDCEHLANRGLKLVFLEDLQAAVREAEFIYACGHEDPDHEIPANRRIDRALLALAAPGMRILHPLPRGCELPRCIDQEPHAAYFEQAGNGVPVRMAVLDRVLRY